MSMLPDGAYDAIVIDAEQTDDGDTRLELTITIGPHIGRVIALRAVHVDERTPGAAAPTLPRCSVCPVCCASAPACRPSCRSDRDPAPARRPVPGAEASPATPDVTGPDPTVDALAWVRAASASAGHGVYLGAGARGPVWAAGERSVLVLGPPRSGKTTSLVAPAVLAAAGPVVSTSTKPDVLEATLRARRRAGPCFVYDPSGEGVDAPGGGDASVVADPRLSRVGRRDRHGAPADQRGMGPATRRRRRLLEGARPVDARRAHARLRATGRVDGDVAVVGRPPPGGAGVERPRRTRRHHRRGPARRDGHRRAARLSRVLVDRRQRARRLPPACGAGHDHAGRLRRGGDARGGRHGVHLRPGAAPEDGGAAGGGAPHRDPHRRLRAGARR